MSDKMGDRDASELSLLELFRMEAESRRRP